MDSNAVNVADIDDLLALLTAEGTGIRSADIDPANVTALPGIWCRFDGASFENLAGATLNLTLHLIVPAAADRHTALVALTERFNQLAPTLRALGGPEGFRMVAVPLPSAPAPLPAFAIPLDLLTTQPEE